MGLRSCPAGCLGWPSESTAEARNTMHEQVGRFGEALGELGGVHSDRETREGFQEGVFSLDSGG